MTIVKVLSAGMKGTYREIQNERSWVLRCPQKRKKTMPSERQTKGE